MATESESGTSLVGGLVHIGKYFQLISIVPATLIVGTIYTLLAAGAPGRAPTLHAMALAADGIDLHRAIAIGFAVLVVGMTLHPFQYAAIQLLEGYWGPTRIAREAMWTRSRLHLR